MHQKEKIFREKAKEDPKRAEHLKKHPHPVKMKSKEAHLKERAKSDPSLAEYLKKYPKPAKLKK